MSACQSVSTNCCLEQKYILHMLHNVGDEMLDQNEASLTLFQYVRNSFNSRTLVREMCQIETKHHSLLLSKI